MFEVINKLWYVVLINMTFCFCLLGLPGCSLHHGEDFEGGLRC